MQEEVENAKRKSFNQGVNFEFTISSKITVESTC